jgi:hypothetical protein
VRSLDEAVECWHAHKLESPAVVAGLRLAARARALVYDAEKFMSNAPAGASVPMMVRARAAAAVAQTHGRRCCCNRSRRACASGC